MKRMLWFLAFLLGGCASPMEQHAATCTGYGFTAGTLEHAQCMQLEQQAAQARMQAASGLLFLQGMELQGQAAAQPQFRSWIAPPVGSAQPVWLAR